MENDNQLLKEIKNKIKENNRDVDERLKKFRPSLSLKDDTPTIEDIAPSLLKKLNEIDGEINKKKNAKP